MSEKLYYVIERMFDTGGITKDQIRFFGTQLWGERKYALGFPKERAIELVKKYRNSFRDYNAQYSIDAVDDYDNTIPPLSSLEVLSEKLGTSLRTAKTNNINYVDYDYVAAFIVDLRHEPDYCIIDRKYIAVSGNLNSDMYYSECVQNADLTHFLETEITGKLITAKIVSGVFRLVYAVTCHGEEYNTQDGVEYDSWETYQLLTKTELSVEELKFIEEPEVDILQQLEDAAHKIGLTD